MGPHTRRSDSDSIRQRTLHAVRNQPGRKVCESGNNYSECPVGSVHTLGTLQGAPGPERPPNSHSDRIPGIARKMKKTATLRPQRAAARAALPRVASHALAPEGVGHGTTSVRTAPARNRGALGSARREFQLGWSMRVGRDEICEVPGIDAIISGGWVGVAHDQERASYDVGSSSSALGQRSPARAAGHSAGKLETLRRMAARGRGGSGATRGR